MKLWSFLSGVVVASSCWDCVEGRENNVLLDVRFTLLVHIPFSALFISIDYTDELNQDEWVESNLIDLSEKRKKKKSPHLCFLYSNR